MDVPVGAKWPLGHTETKNQSYTVPLLVILPVANFRLQLTRLTSASLAWSPAALPMASKRSSCRALYEAMVGPNLTGTNRHFVNFSNFRP